jgi:O-antigen ligase
MVARLDRAEGVWLAGLAGLAAIVGVLAGLDPRLAIAASLAVGFVLLVFADLAVGLAVFCVLTFLEVLPLASGLTLAKLSGGLVALAWLAVIATRPDSRDDFFGAHPWVSAALGTFLGWSLLSLAWAEDPGAALGATSRFALNIVLFLIVFTALRTRRQALLASGAFLVGAVAAAFYGFVSGAAQVEYGGRLTGTTLDPNELASVLVAGVALSGGVAANLRHSPGLRLAALAGGGVCMLGIFLTVSRGGLLALGLALACAIVLAGKARMKVIVAAVVVLFAGWYYFAELAPPEARERLAQSPQGESRLLEGRTTIWQVGWRMVEANAAKGVGAGNFPIASRHYLLQPGAVTRSDQILIEDPQVAHNTYLGILAELGIVGLALFLVIIVFCVVSCVQAARNFRIRGDPGGEALARAMAVALVGVLAADFFITQEYNKQLWLLLGFGPALLSISKASRESE